MKRMPGTEDNCLRILPPSRDRIPRLIEQIRDVGETCDRRFDPDIPFNLHRTANSAASGGGLNYDKPFR